MIQYKSVRTAVACRVRKVLEVALWISVVLRASSRSKMKNRNPINNGFERILLNVMSNAITCKFEAKKVDKVTVFVVGR